MPKTRRNKGRMGMRKSKRLSRFNKRNSKVYHNTRFSNKAIRRNANKKVEQKIDSYLKTHIRKVPDDYKYKELMARVYKTDDEVLKQMLIKQANPKDFKNMGKQVDKLMGKPLDINTFFNLMLIFWVVQDKLVKHGLRPIRR